MDIIRVIKANEFVDLDYIDYDYKVEDFLIDVNNFKIEQPQINVTTKPKDKKGTKDKKKDKSKGGSNVSKQSSGLTALSNKKKFINNATKDTKLMIQINNNKKIQQQLKNAQKGYKSAGKKIENQIKQIIATTKKSDKEEPLVIKEETVFTGEKKELEDEEEIEVRKNPNPKKQKKIKKPNNPVLTETKPPAIENKQIDDFISQLKSQKTQKELEITKKVEIISIRNFIKQFRDIVSEDATKKLKVKENVLLEDDFIISFLNKFSEIISYCYDNYSKNTDFLKQNIKEAIILTDNLCENMIQTNKCDINILDKLTTIFFSLNEKLSKDNFIVREIDVFLINLVYLYSKYQNFFSSNSGEISSTVESLNFYLNQQFENILKTDEMKINNSKFEVIYLMKLIFNILYSKAKNLNIKSYVLDNSNKALLTRIENLQILSTNDPSVDNIDSEKIVKTFVNSLDEVKILIKLSHILDKHKNSIFTLNIITTKNIESKLIDIQKIILGENKQKYMLLIYKIITVFLKNFSHFQYIESNYEDKNLTSISDEISHLIKILLDEKIFENSLFIEHLLSHIEKYEISEFPFEKEENSKIYVKFLLDFFKIFEKIISCSRIVKNKVAIDIFVHFFHSIMINILNLKNNTYKEKYLILLKDCIIKYYNFDGIQEHIITYLISFVEEKLIYIDDNANLMRNIKIIKEFVKFYSMKDLKIDYLSILQKIPSNKRDIEVNIIMLIFLELIQTAEDYQSLNKYLLSNDNLFNKFMYFEKKLCNLWLRNTYTNENEILKKINNNLLYSSISLRDNFEYYFKVFHHFEIEKTKSELNIDLYKFVKFSNRLIKINKDQKYSSFSTQFDQIINQINKIRNVKFECNIMNETLMMYLLNKICYMFNENKEIFSTRLFECIDKLEKELNKTSINLKDEIRKLNSIDNYHFDLNFTFKSQNEILPYFLQIIHIIKQIEIDVSRNCFKKSIELTEIKENVNSQIAKYNLDIILKYFILYLLYTIKNISSDNYPLFLNNFLVVQESMNEILNSDVIFKSFTQNSKLLTLFVKEYSNLILEMNKIFEKCGNYITQKLNFKENLTEISSSIVTQSIIKSITSKFCDFIIKRCSVQIVNLFSEKELYRLTLIKNQRLLKILFERLNIEYTKTILEESKVPEIIKKLQLAEENDEEMDAIAKSIFSNEIIQFLEYPSEIIDYLSNIHERMKLEIKDSTQHNYLNPTIFSYLYVWKIIMSKIENGFKLFTTDKKFVKNIDDYKTILKMLVNYFERNNKIYEMFLLISLTLIHLDEDYVDKFLTGSNDVLQKIDSFDETQFTNIYDENCFYFILNVLFKFVKIFPSHVKFWFDKSHKKLHNTFNKIVKNIINQKMMIEIKDKLNQFKSSIANSGIIMKEFKSNNFIDLRLNLNDEIYFEITVEFPNIFPLKKINLKLNSNANLEEMKMMTVKMSLNNVFNASIDNISDNLILWSENVKQILLTGMDCCPICYYYIQQTDKSLPKLTCKTCKKKFHSMCMKEWFKNSDKKTCPICRSEWH